MSIGMSDELNSFEQRALIKVCGVGGAGGNAIARMIEEGLDDVEFIAINTDAQALQRSPAGCRLQIGSEFTGGLGSGAKPEIGLKAALEDRERISDVVTGADMVFITCGLGGGTGTGAAPIVAEIARGSGALTVGIATLPFSFEGKERMDNALNGLQELEERVDTLIVVPNDRVAQICQDNMSLLQAFRQADEVLHNGVRAISDLITVPGLINLDFADVRTIMQSRGRALMGIGTAEGENRAVRAAEEAIVCPLLEQSNIDGAMGVIANVTAGCDVGMREVQDAVATVQEAAHPEANIIFGAVVDDEERPEIQVTVIAAGFQRGVTREFLGASGATAELVDLHATREKLAERAEQPSAEALPAAASAGGSVPPGGSGPEEGLSLKGAGQVEYLFPPDGSEIASQPVRSEPDEDLGIPAFMRRRKRKQ